MINQIMLYCIREQMIFVVRKQRVKLPDQAISQKDNGNSVIVSGIVPRHDKLNNKANEVNNCLVLIMCKEEKIQLISPSESIDTSKHLNESKLHLNHNGIKVFAEYFSVFLKKFN